MRKWFKFIFSGVGLMLGFIASISPGDAQNNLSEWAEVIGWEKFSKFLDTPSADAWGFWLGILMIFFGFMWWIVEKKKQKKKPKPKWVSVHRIVDYVAYESKFALPTKWRPIWASTIMAAWIIHTHAKNDILKIKGLKKNTSDYEIIKPDYWRLAQFDFLKMINPIKDQRVSKTELNRLSIQIGAPPVPAYMDLTVDIHEIKRVFPPLTRWDKSKVVKGLRNRWTGASKRKVAVTINPIKNRDNNHVTR